MNDLRATVTTTFGPLAASGSGLDHDFVHDNGLVAWRGQLVYPKVFRPAKGARVEMLYARPNGTTTRMWPRLHVMGVKSNPWERTTTVDVGCMIEASRNRRDFTAFSPQATPPAWWSNGSQAVKDAVPPPVSAQLLINHCLAAVGIPQAAGNAGVSDSYLLDSVDLSQGYLQIVNDILFDNSLRGWMLPDGTIRIRRLDLGAAGGPVIREEDWRNLEPIQGATQAAGTVRVSYSAVESDRLAGEDPTEAGEDPGDLANDDSLGDLRFLEDDQGLTEDQRRRRNWELEITYGPPEVCSILYTARVGGQQVQARADFPYAPVSRSESSYRTFYWTDLEGQRQQQDVVIRRSTTVSTCYAEANGAYAQSVLEAGLSFRGTDVAYRTTETLSEYSITREGPVLFRETELQYEPTIQFAGGLGIKNWVPGGSPIQVGAAPAIQVHRRVTVSRADEEEGMTYRATTRFCALGKKQAGNQASGSQDATINSPAAAYAVIDAAMAEVCEGTEVTLNWGRDFGTQSRPSRAGRAIRLLEDGIGAANNTGVTSTTSEESEATVADEAPSFALGSKSVEVKASFGGGTFDQLSTNVYSLTYSPDDVLAARDDNGRIVQFISGGRARERATEFGLTRNRLDFGHSNGYQVTAAPWYLPEEPWSPVLLEAAGVSAAFRLNACSWEIGEGLVVCSASLLLVGSAGRLSAGPAPWVPSPSDPADLVLLPPASGSGDPVPANTISTPGGFDPDDPASTFALLPENGTFTPGIYRDELPLVPPFVEIEAIDATTRFVAVIRQFDYALDNGTDQVLGITEMVGEVIDPDNQPEIDQAAITYSQSSTYSGNAPATNAAMTNGMVAEYEATGTDYVSGNAWVQMDLGAVFPVRRIHIAPDWYGNLSWGPSDTENCNIESSTDGTTWTVRGNTGTWTTPQQILSVNFSARYIRVIRHYDESPMAVTEFTAFSTDLPAAAVDQSAITYSQSSVLAGRQAATNQRMNDGTSWPFGSFTATGADSPFAWVQMDLQSPRWVRSVTVGSDFSNGLSAGGKARTENMDLEHSLDGTSWTVFGNTGTFDSFATAIKSFPLNAEARYIRIRTSAAETLIVTEFTAFS